MNIVYDHQIFGWHEYGGISRYFYEIANYIAGIHGNKVEIVAPLYLNEYLRNSRNIQPQGVKIRRIPGTVSVVRLVNAIASRLLVRPRTDVDIFHETYYTMADCCPRSARRVVTVYDMIHERFPDSFSPRDRVKQIKAHAVQRADHVICISENTRRDLIETLGIPEEKTSVCYLGCSLSTRIAQNATQKRSPYILYVGHRGGYKNYETLLRAYGHSTLLKSEYRLVCFGGGAFTSREKAMIEELSILPTSIRQVSGNDDVLAGLYNTASVFVYPSLYEGFGIPPLEAMSFDCPVVCSNAGSLPEVVGNAAEMCDPRDEEDMRQAIVKVVTSSDLSRDMVSRGRLRVKIFSWERCARETLATYKKILQT